MNMTARCCSWLRRHAAGRGLAWVLRNPVFAIGGIGGQGDVAHNNAVTLRANVAPRLRGTSSPRPGRNPRGL
jgi:hypothetical protein